MRDGEPKVGEVLVVLEEVSGVWILRVNHVRDAVRLERLLVRRRADVSDVERPAVGKLEDGGYILVEATRSGLILETARGWGRRGGGALTPSCRSYFYGLNTPDERVCAGREIFRAEAGRGGGGRRGFAGRIWGRLTPGA